MKLFLGIDGGGTKTRAVFVDSKGNLLGQGEAGASNYHNVGMKSAVEAIRNAAAQAGRQAGLTKPIPHAVFLGCAGIKASVDVARLTSAAEMAGIGPAGEITVANDLHNALAGGLTGRPGIALIAGTGTNCLGRDASAGTFMCGGWGWLLDDVGGGIGLALAAFRAAARAADGRAPQTHLLPATLAFLGLSQPNEILARLYVERWTPDELAGFAPVVERCAEEGDATAKRILLEGAKALGNLVAGAAKSLHFPEGPEVVILGGCARSGPCYLPLIEAAIRKSCKGACLVDPEHSTVHGAALNALRAGGIDPIPKLKQHA